MVIRIALVYPDTLPGPSTGGLQAAERRMLAAEPMEARTVERDRRKTQQIALGPFTDAEAAIFQAWFDDDLEDGGAWFESTWPMPQALVDMGYAAAVRRWIGEPTWQKGQAGFWTVTGPCEVRGRGLSPYKIISDCMIAGTAAEIALTEPEGVFLWRSNDPSPANITAYEDSFGPLVGSYTSVGRSTGSVGAGTFPIAFVVDWADLVAPPGVSVFSGIRDGIYPTDTQPVSIAVTGAPEAGTVAQCRACVFQTVGSWSGGGLDGNPKGFWASSTLPITFPDGGVMHPAHHPDTIGSGYGIAQAVFLLRAEGGVVTGVPIS